MSTGQGKDVIIDVGIDDRGSLQNIATAIQEIDQRILQTIKNAERFESQLKKLRLRPDGQRDTQKDVQLSEQLSRLTSELKQDQKARRTLAQAAKTGADASFNRLPPNQQTPQLKAQVQAFKSVIDDPLKSFNKEMGRLLEKMTKLQERSLQQMMRQQTAQQRRSMVSQIGNDRHHPEQHLRGRSNQYIAGLGSEARRFRSESEKIGNLSAVAAADAALATIKKVMSERAEPAVRRRLDAAQSMLGDQTRIQRFLASNSEQEVQQTIKTLRKEAGTLGRQNVNDPNARNYAQLANQLNDGLKQLAPAMKNVAALARDIGARGAPTALAGRDRNELKTFEQAFSREMRRATVEGRRETAEQMKTAMEGVKSMAYQMDHPTRMARRNSLMATAASADFPQALGRLTAGQSQSGLEQLLKDANTLYRSERETKGESEPLRRLVEELKKLVKQQNDQNRSERTASPRQERAALESQQIARYAQQRYSRTMMPSTQTMVGMNIDQLETSQDRARMLEQAQRLRVQRAQENGQNVRVEQQALQQLRRQTQELENQLKIRRDMARQASRENSPEFQRMQAQRTRDRVAAYNSQEAVRMDVLRGLNRNETRRQMDGGADMFRNQAMLLRNYAVMGAGVGGTYATGSFIAQLDRGFAQLQSILALTNNDMEQMKGNLIQISELTKFDAVEVVDTAVILGQAGLSKEQITASLQSITMFATAIGTDLKSAVDLATSALGVFNIEASRMPSVVDKLTVAINSSKLNLDKLSLGIQYAGNIAEQSNVTFEETVAALGAMANSGIKSGSTLGTGLRQILITLQKPSDAFRQKMDDLGISMDQLDLRTHSLIDIMQTLSSGGFTVADAMQVMEVRAASAFSAFANNIDKAREITREMENNGAATRANEVQMEALVNQWARFASISKSIFFEALEPFVKLLTNTLRLTGDLLTSMKELGTVVQLVVGGFVALQGIRLVGGIGRLGGRVLSGNLMGGNAARSGGQTQMVQVAAQAATQALTSTAGRGALLTVARGLVGGPWGLAAAGAMTVGTMAWSRYNRQSSLDDELDKARFTSGIISARQEKTTTGINTIDKLLGEAFYQRSQFSDSDQGQQALSQFVRRLNEELRSVGFNMDATLPSFEAVVGKLQELRTELVNLSNIDLERAGLAAAEEARIEQSRLSEFRGSSVLSDAQGRFQHTQAQSNQRQQQMLFQLSRVDSNVFGGWNRNQNNRLMSRVRSATEASPEQLKALQEKLTGRETELTRFLRDNDALVVQDKTGMSLPDAQRLLDEVRSSIEDLRTAQGRIGGILSNFDALSEQEREKLRKAVENQLRLEFSNQASAMIDQLGSSQQLITQSNDSPLTKFEGLLDLREEANTALNDFQRKLRERAIVIIDELPNASEDDRGALMAGLGALLSDTGLPGSLSTTQASMQDAVRRASPDALRDLRGRSRDRTNSIRAEQELIQNELADANSIDRIAKLEQELLELVRRQNETNRQLRQAETIENPKAWAEAQREMATQLDAEEAGVRLRAQQERARFEAMARFRSGDFSMETDSRTNAREIARAARQVFSENDAQVRAQLQSSLAGAQDYRLLAESSNRTAQQAQQAAGDSGLLEGQRVVAVEQAVQKMQQAMQLANDAVALEINAYTDARIKQAEELAQLQRELENLQPGDLRYEAATARVNQLEPAIETNNRRISELNREIGRNTEEMSKAIAELRGSRELAFYQERRYMDEERRRTGALIHGGGFQTDAQIGRGQGESERLAADTESLAEKVRRSTSFVLSESSKAYEGFDGLTEATLGLKELMEGMGDSAGSFFSQWAQGSMSASAAFRGFGLSIMQTLTDMAMKIAANQIMMMILGSFMGAQTNGMMAGTPGAYSGGAVTAWTGGPIPAPRRYRAGGHIQSGMRQRDSTLVHAAQGEFMLRNEAVEAIGLDTAHMLNNLDKGSAKALREMGEREPVRSSEGGDKTVNVWVVSEKEMPVSMDENNILVVVDKALMRNSSTKKLVKRISTGDM